MADDIVTLLRMPICGNYDDDHLSWGPQPCSSCVEAADEIERLRAIIKDIANAVTDEGRKPGYHKQQVNYVRTMWNPLYKAISKAVKEEKKWTQEQ